MEFTKEQLIEHLRSRIEHRKGLIASIHIDRGYRDYLKLELRSSEIALASLEAEAVCVIDQSNLDYLKSGSDADVWPASRAEMGDVLLYRSATPAPVSVPAAMEMDDDFDSAFEHGKAVGWNAYRAAMLQSFGNSEQLNSPVIPDGWVLVPEEPNHEMLEAGDEQFGTYDVYRRMIAASPQQEVMP
ncbi:hypothetical protein KAM546c_09070 [Enterobacter roggenkampii]|uniref:hypothetical protein n=1 Tax=Enterobacter roggenkampii TaxID=1812935 RepID=UPI0021FDE0E9|nr:hypothetical protein [Enterobacter roggenkampii]BDS19646.1 hypothetical protein KAM546c_09070 [Enterobacter roggenkampii]